MIPRKRLDIDWSDLLFGMAQCFRKNSRTTIEAGCKNATPAPDKAICFLSVRSGLDLLLQVLKFPKGSEVLISAITIPDIVTILKAHHLIPLPIDLNPDTLHPDPSDLETKITPRTVAIIITHLFGARVPMDDITPIAKLHGLMIFEDCAQGYWGDGYIGHPNSDVCMFSFGPIKLNTALGGALFFLQNPTFQSRVAQRHATYGIQNKWRFLQRLLKYSTIKILSHPIIYSIFCSICRLMHKSHDDISFYLTRGFSGDALFKKLRQQPSYPLLALLHRRLKSNAFARTTRRRESARNFRCLIPQICCPGFTSNHSFWVFPILVSNAQKLCKRLLKQGFDAHTWPVSLCVVNHTKKTSAPHNALTVQQQILFIPVYPTLTQYRLNQLSRIICQFARPHDQTPLWYTSCTRPLHLAVKITNHKSKRHRS